MGDAKRLKLDAELKDALPPELYAKLMDEMEMKSDDFKCSICIEDRCSLPVMFKPCEHVFCLECAAVHCQNKMVCPTCIRGITNVVAPMEYLPHYKSCHPSSEPLSPELDAKKKAFTNTYMAMYNVKGVPKLIPFKKFKASGRLTFLDHKTSKKLIMARKTLAAAQTQRNELTETIRKTRDEIAAIMASIPGAQ